MKAKRETALITGATSGIGREFVDIFAGKGYDLFLVSRSREKMDSIKKAVEVRFGNTVTVMPIDLAKPLSAHKVYEESIRLGMDVRVLVNNAGFAAAGEHVDLDGRRVEEMIQLNIATPTELCALFGGDMKKKKSGYILNVASTAAYQPTPYIAVYGATKSYVLSFSEALAKEMEDYKVVVTCLSPGPTDTGFFEVAGGREIAEKQQGFWGKRNRMPAREAAEIGVWALFAKKLSVVAGNLNGLMAAGSRIAPRCVAASVSKRLMKKATDGL